MCGKLLPSWAGNCRLDTADQWSPAGSFREPAPGVQGHTFRCNADCRWSAFVSHRRNTSLGRYCWVLCQTGSFADGAPPVGAQQWQAVRATGREAFPRRWYLCALRPNTHLTSVCSGARRHGHLRFLRLYRLKFVKRRLCCVPRKNHQLKLRANCRLRPVDQSVAATLFPESLIHSADHKSPDSACCT